MAFLKTLQIGFSVKFIFMRLPCILRRKYCTKSNYSCIIVKIYIIGDNLITVTNMGEICKSNGSVYKIFIDEKH